MLNGCLVCYVKLLQLIQNSLTRAVIKAAKSCYITPILCSLHWLKKTEHIEYKLLSLTYNVLTPAEISTGFASWQRYCTAVMYWASAKLCGVEQRVAPPIFGRVAITLGIGPHF